MKFLTAPPIVPLVFNRWRLAGTLLFVDSQDRVWNIPEGFEYDLASVPRIFWSLYPPQISTRASAVHDWLYVYQPVSRKEADQILYEGLIAEGVPKYRAKIIWSAVRAGGYFPWRKRKKDLGRGR